MLVRSPVASESRSVKYVNGMSSVSNSNRRSSHAALRVLKLRPQGTAEAVAGLSSDFTPVWAGDECLRAKPRPKQAGGVIVPPSPLTVLPWQVLSALYLILRLAGFISAVHPQHWYKDTSFCPTAFLKHSCIVSRTHKSFFCFIIQ